MPIKAAVIGTGRIASEHLAALRALPGVEIAAVCDLSPATAQAAAERFGAARWYTDHRRMLDEAKPQVVHVTTPPSSHAQLAADALDSGAHAFVEKPITLHYGELPPLRSKAQQAGRWLIEDHNYQFNPPVQRVLAMIADGRFGEVVHVEVLFCLAMRGGGLADPNAPVKLPGGSIGHFLTHLAYLSYIFVGPHRAVSTVWRKHDRDLPVQHDEFRALVNAERGTAMLGFSGRSQPDGFLLRVYGTKMQAAINLLENRLTLQRLRGGPRPLMPLLNAREQSRQLRRSAWQTLLTKLSGRPVSYAGLWELIARLYGAMQRGEGPPVSPDQIDATNRLVAELVREELRL